MNRSTASRESQYYMNAPIDEAAHSLHSTKDINYHPLFRGQISRFLWRIYTHRITHTGKLFLSLTFIFMLYGSSSLDIQIFVPFTYAVGLWSIAVIATMFAKPQVTVKANYSDRISAGQTMPVDIEITQTGRNPGSDLSVLPYRLPQFIDSEPLEGVTVPALEMGETARVRLGLACNKRGVYTLRGFRVQTDFPFGLLRAYRFYQEERRLVVYPYFTVLSRCEIPTGRSYQPGGVALASTLADSFEFVANREYRDGDNIRDIDWRATARLDRPIVREYRQEYFHRVGIILDTHLPDALAVAENAVFERAVSMCAAVSDFISRKDYIIDLFAAGPNLYHFTAGRSLAYLDQILEILSCLNMSETEPFDVIEPELMDHVARITTVICIFLDWNQARQEFAYRLQEAGAGVKVIVVRDTPTTMNIEDDFRRLGVIRQITRDEFAAGIEEL